MQCLFSAHFRAYLLPRVFQDLACPLRNRNRPFRQTGLDRRSPPRSLGAVCLTSGIGGRLVPGGQSAANSRALFGRSTSGRILYRTRMNVAGTCQALQAAPAAASPGDFPLLQAQPLRSENLGPPLTSMLIPYTNYCNRYACCFV